MNCYVQYHNVAKEGLPLSDPPFSATRLGIYTRRPNVKNADGRVFLVAGIGRPRRFFLWQAFEVEEVMAKAGGRFEAFGTGWQLAPPQELTGKPFEAFKSACANFVGFRCVNDLPFARTLNRLAEENRPPGGPSRIVNFLKALDGLLEDEDPARRPPATPRRPAAALGHARLRRGRRPDRIEGQHAYSTLARSARPSPAGAGSTSGRWSSGRAAGAARLASCTSSAPWPMAVPVECQPHGVRLHAQHGTGPSAQGPRPRRAG